MFDKDTVWKIDPDSVEILDGELIKTAAIQLPDGVEYDPDFFYMKVRAVSAGEYWGCNKNFDYFPEEELKKSYKTFLNAHVFKNHENKDVANAIGDVIDAYWDDQMKCVILIIKIDRRIAPTVVRNFEKGTVTDVSMGCRIQYSICPICGNKSKTKFEYCDHIKYMRGKVMNDGKKVYEINIGPKFHDISAVLNGAEKSAKAIDMIIDNKNKKATEAFGKMEKAASFKDLACAFDVDESTGITKVAFDVDFEIFEKKASKKEYIQKVAEIKKEIQGKILNIAKGELMGDKADTINSVSKIVKLLYTKYWDKAKCSEIAEQLRELACAKEAPLEVVFHQFLKVLDFAGIDLSPLELHDIYSALVGDKSPDLRDISMAPPEDFEGFMDDVDKAEDDHAFTHAINMPTMFTTMQNGVGPNLQNIAGLEENPANRLKAVVIKLRMPTPLINEDMMYGDIMDRVVKDLMPDRSAHRRFIMKRFDNIANGSAEPNPKNTIHFMPAKMLGAGKVSKKLLPFILSALMHSNYERERVAHFNDEAFEYGLTKFASYIEGDSINNLFNEFAVEKTASKRGKGYTVPKAIFIGIPLTYAYSALQRARINNGDNVNTFNRYVAENPGNAGLMQAVAGPMVIKKIRGGMKNFDQALTTKYASEESFFEDIFKMASLGNDNSLYEKDMFKDAQIDNALKEVYNDNQIVTLKQACILNFMDRQDLSSEILSKQALTEADLGKYLKIAKDSIKIEIEKNASTIPSLAKGTAVNTMFHAPSGASTIGALPGLLIDTAAFLWLTKKLDEKAKK